MSADDVKELLDEDVEDDELDESGDQLEVEDVHVDEDEELEALEVDDEDDEDEPDDESSGDEPDDDEDEDEDEEDEDDDEDEDEAVAASDDESDQASLEELLAQRAATKRAAVDGEDEGDIMALTSEASRRERLRATITPIRDRQEFVCARCHLVKNKAQLADRDRGLCRDCV